MSVDTSYRNAQFTPVLPLDDLPEEILIHIFHGSGLGPHSLASLRQACTTWRKLLDGTLSKLTLKGWVANTRVATTFPTLSTINMSRCRVDTHHVTAVQAVDDLCGLSRLSQLVLQSTSRPSLR